MYFIASSFSGRSPMRRTGSGEIDSPVQGRSAGYREDAFHARMERADVANCSSLARNEAERLAITERARVKARPGRGGHVVVDVVVVLPHDRLPNAHGRCRWMEAKALHAHRRAASASPPGPVAPPAAAPRPP